MLDYSNLQHHPISEQIVTAICEKVGTTNREFFRTHVAYYLSVVAACMRTSIAIPGAKPEPVNLYAINLAPSGFGKGYSTAIMEGEVIKEFQNIFIQEAMPIMANINLPKLAHTRAIRKGADPDEELLKVEAEYAQLGEYIFSFDSATSPAVKQARHRLLMANAGALNLQIDEIGINFAQSKEVMPVFLELFNGRVKQKLVKNTRESLRNEDIDGITPTNLMMFGVPSGLLDGGKNEDELLSLLEQGFARRCFFGMVSHDPHATLDLLSPQEQLDQINNGNADAILAGISNKLGNLAATINAHKTLKVPEDTALRYLEYKNDCAIRAHELREHEHIRKTEMLQRFYKAMKLAGAYAFVDESPEVTVAHYEAAMAIAEESGNAFDKILNRERPYVKLARYMSETKNEVTQADLLEDLPLYRVAKTGAQKAELMSQAIAWGYKNNIIIKKRYTDGIEFYRGETLTGTDLDNIRISYSDDIAAGYRNDFAPFDKLHQLTQQKDLHWINHHLDNGHRSDEHCIPGFNIVVIDVDKDVSLQMAKTLLKDYKALYYTTKRHTDDENRFRIIMPTNYQLSLDTQDFKDFMKNLFEWLPFDSDTATGQRARKWLTHPGHYEYTDGDVLDVLPFIPKTSKNEERKRKFNDLQSLDNLERWVIQNTGDGNRNNQLMRYAFILVDSGYDYPQIQELIMSMNDKLVDKLSDTEIFSTIMSTVNKAILKREA